MKIMIDGYRNKKHLALIQVTSGKFEIQIEGVKYGHQFRNYQNAKQTFLTLMTGFIGKDL
jgi:hypothetical protein